ncbi:glycoside hydrolase family 2 protein [Lacisediminihabitans sp. H27-G8]|uniref:glycoside hydrolase family 2 protein n=1 Tax=Lacisediminihabitans sp. H27-G8 TaxID=3111909 RepID=UPI0038FC85CA
MNSSSATGLAAVGATRPVVRRLDFGWTLAAVRGPIPTELVGISVPASVPGTVHTDLLAAGLIPDPYLDANEGLLRWIGQTDWRYSTSFKWSPVDTDTVEIAFGGLDTITEIRLNGTLIGSTRNMHRSYRFDVAPLLIDGDNELCVDFSAPVTYADRASLELEYRPHTNRHPYNAIRKMACSFGWDWGIDTATSGIWRPVTIESFSVARIKSVRPVATVGDTGAGGMVVVHVELARPGDADLALVATIDGHTVELALEPGQTDATLIIDLPSVKRWWPRGYGEPNLYELSVTLHDNAGNNEERSIGEHSLDKVIKRIGFRHVELQMTPDDAGTPFTIRVNDRPIYVKGANWIPDDAFPHRVDRARYAARLEQAEFAGINLIRVWGGGIYESEDFYDECDERGFLTWQDFLLACAAYAEEEPLFSEFEAEAREAVARIGTHPSLVVFNGNNENIWGYTEWGWPLRLEGKTWGSRYYYELFPAIVAELAPHVGYTPGSPFSPGNPESPNDPDHGTMHIWDLWNQKDYSHYRDYAPRFVSEFGWQGPPSWATLTESISDNPLTPESPGMLAHQKATEGNAKLTDGLVRHFPLPNDMEDWHWAMSLNQAVAIRTAIEYFRSLAPHCMGSIVWQLNDSWPVTSWAAVDGYGRAKPLLHALRRAHADRLVTLQPSDGGVQAIMINDTDRDWSGTLAITRYDFSGSVLAAEQIPIHVLARASWRQDIPGHIAVPGDETSEMIRADLDGHSADWFFADYRESSLPEHRLRSEFMRNAAGYLLTVYAETLVRDLTLLVDKVAPDARVDQALVTLLPGESATFAIETDGTVLENAITAPEVLRSANQLIARMDRG